MNSILFLLLAVSVGQANEKATYQIALSVQQEEQSGIYVINADGSDSRRLTTNRNDILPRWSPDGKLIAFLSLREQDHELATEHNLAFHWFLYVMDAEGQKQRRVTKTPIGMIFQWSPDGSRFLFQSSYEDRSNKGKDGTVSSAIYVMNADGTQQKRLTPIEKIDNFPAWSPDGKQIAFTSNRDGNMDIYVMNADGSSMKQLTNDAANDMNPIWSSDGKKIAFTSYRRQRGDSVYSVGANGVGERSLANSGRPVVWSPDGSMILVATDGQIAVIGADGQNHKRLTRPGGRALDGVFSPDGKGVFFRWKGKGDWKIVTVGLDGQQWKQVTDLSSALGFSLSPIKTPRKR
jgi:Tol biopolymer transport system component